MRQLKSCIKKSNINIREDLNHMCNAHEGAIEQGKEIRRRDGIEIGRKDGIEIGRNSQKLENAKNLLIVKPQ